MPPKRSKLVHTYTSQEFDGVVIEEDCGDDKGRKWKRKRVKILHPDYFQHAVNQFNVGDRVTTKITNKKRNRTQNQHRYYFLVLSLLALSSGHTTDELHSWAKGQFLSQGITEIFGSKVRKIKSTTKLTVLEFIEYLERIAEATGMELPDPEPFSISPTHDEWNRLKEEQKKKYKAFRPKIKI